MTKLRIFWTSKFLQKVKFLSEKLTSDPSKKIFYASEAYVLGMEMVELNPILDNQNVTGELAVWLILSALGKTILGDTSSPRSVKWVYLYKL